MCGLVNYGNYCEPTIFSRERMSNIFSVPSKGALIILSPQIINLPA